MFGCCEREGSGGDTVSRKFNLLTVSGTVCSVSFAHGSDSDRTPTGRVANEPCCFASAYIHSNIHSRNHLTVLKYGACGLRASIPTAKLRPRPDSILGRVQFALVMPFDILKRLENVVHQLSFCAALKSESRAKLAENRQDWGLLIFSRG